MHGLSEAQSPKINTKRDTTQEYKTHCAPHSQYREEQANCVPLPYIITYPIILCKPLPSARHFINLRPAQVRFPSRFPPGEISISSSMQDHAIQLRWVLIRNTLPWLASKALFTLDVVVIYVEMCE